MEHFFFFFDNFGYIHIFYVMRKFVLISSFEEHKRFNYTMDLLSMTYWWIYIDEPIEDGHVFCTKFN